MRCYQRTSLPHRLLLRLSRRSVAAAVSWLRPARHGLCNVPVSSARRCRKPVRGATAPVLPASPCVRPSACWSKTACGCAIAPPHTHGQKLVGKGDTQARREPQRGLGKTFWRRICFSIVLFRMAHFGVLYISERQRDPETSRGPGKTSPFPILHGSRDTLVGVWFSDEFVARVGRSTKFCFWIGVMVQPLWQA